MALIERISVNGLSGPASVLFIEEKSRISPEKRACLVAARQNHQVLMHIPAEVFDSFLQHVNS